MDPNEALRRIRAACHELAKLDDGSEDPQLELEGLLIQSVRDLDEWLSKGGFLPSAWQPGVGEIDPDYVLDRIVPLGPPNCGTCGEPANEVTDHVVDGIVYHADCIPDPDTGE